MNKVKITSISSDEIRFDNGASLSSHHHQDCCEHDYLEFNYVKIDEVKDLEFDLSGDSFFKKIDGYGIELIPLNGFSVKIPGYADNNGYYSSDLSLDLYNGEGNKIKSWDITECQTGGHN